MYPNFPRHHAGIPLPLPDVCDFTGEAYVVVVTGATGHLGTVLVSQLVNRGEKVRYITRNGIPRGLDGSSAVPITADLFDRKTLVRAFAGASVVYHSAARISIMTGDWHELEHVNVEGTRVVLDAAREAGVGRFVHVGSIEAFPLEGGHGPITETAGFDPDRTVMEYGRSKALGMQVVLDAADKDLECVVCCPTAFLGPPDYRRSPLGQVIFDFLRGRLPAYVDGGFDFVDVRDVADGVIGAGEKGQSGRVYLLAGRYATVPELMEMIEAASGIRKPALRIPSRVLIPFMPVIEAYYRVSKLSPRFTRNSLQLLSLNVRVDATRARTELGFDSRPLEETLADTVRWFSEVGAGDSS
jgi:nucleoside-diphosphate-sugar epimerase